MRLQKIQHVTFLDSSWAALRHFARPSLIPRTVLEAGAAACGPRTPPSAARSFRLKLGPYTRASRIAE